MSPTEVKDLAEQIDEFSLIDNQVEGAFGDGRIPEDFQDVLLSLASILRKKDLAYTIEYRRPDQPVFRLRSDRDFGEDPREFHLDFSEPGRRLELKTDNPGEAVFRGLQQELRILSDLGTKDEDEAVREPALNLLVSRTFQAELYSEYQRWKRYESPFLVALAYLKQDQSDWEPVGRAFKHVAQSRDIIGYLGEGRVAAFFPSLYDRESRTRKLSEQLSGRYDPEELDLSFFTVPDDFDDWNSLKKRVFSPIYLTET